MVSNAMICTIPSFLTLKFNHLIAQTAPSFRLLHNLLNSNYRKVNKVLQMIILRAYYLTNGCGFYLKAKNSQQEQVTNAFSIIQRFFSSVEQMMMA